LAEKLVTDRRQRDENAVAQYKCQFCDQQFSSFLRYDNHMSAQACLFRIPYYTEYGQRRCGFCEEAFSSLKLLEDHGIKHQLEVVHPVGYREFEKGMENAGHQNGDIHYFSIARTAAIE